MGPGPSGFRADFKAGFVMKSFILLLLLLLLPLLSCAARVLYDERIKVEFEKWCRKYQVKYESEEERSTKLQIFKSNFEHVKQHNAASRGLYELELNIFADKEGPGEGQELSQRNERNASRRVVTHEVKISNATTPSAVDWRARGGVFPGVPIQHCNDCWILASIGALEGAYFAKTGNLVKLSSQELIDWLDGCRPGAYEIAYKFTAQHGIHRAVDYSRYINTTDNITTDECLELPDDIPKVKTSGLGHYSITGGRDHPHDIEAAMEQAVVNQPIVASIEGRCIAFYKKGIFQQADPKQRAVLNHMVVIVGYGSENGVDYWILRNSWGEGWGENGYMRLRRRTSAIDGECGIHTSVGYPTLDTFSLPLFPPSIINPAEP